MCVVCRHGKARKPGAIWVFVDEAELSEQAVAVLCVNCTCAVVDRLGVVTIKVVVSNSKSCHGFNISNLLYRTYVTSLDIVVQIQHFGNWFESKQVIRSTRLGM